MGLKYDDLTGTTTKNGFYVINAVQGSSGHGKHKYWNAVCPVCHKVCKIRSDHLVLGDISSCGCSKSKGEEKIAKILDEHNIEFERQKRFRDCKYKSQLPFDFYVTDKNIVIEFNGIQHYQPVEHFGGEEEFKLREKRDILKRKYCENANIGYLVIAYDEDILKKLLDAHIICA